MMLCTWEELLFYASLVKIRKCTYISSVLDMTMSSYYNYFVVEDIWLFIRFINNSCCWLKKIREDSADCVDQII